MAQTQNTYDTLPLIAIMDMRAKHITNNWGTRKPLLAALRASNAMEIWDGGTNIVPHLRYGDGGQGQRWIGDDRIVARQSDYYKSPSYPRRHIAMPIVWTKDEEDACQNEQQALPIVKVRMEDAELSLEEMANTDFWGDGIGDGGRKMNGMQALIEVSTDATSTTPVQVGTGTVGGLSRSTDTWFRNWCSKGAYTTAAYDNVFSAITLMDIYTSKDGTSFSAGFTTKLIMAALHQIVWGKTTFMVQNGNSPGVKLGFPHIEWNGRQIYADDTCPSGCLYMPNFEHLKFYIIRSENFTLGPVITPESQPGIRFRYLGVGGNLSLDSAEKQGVIYGIT